ncbi:hypothetical protein [Paraflavitalea speifideaquila]|uniref:hypothetical protein n=1 Tax=Paraflavitalea speifideaquila TaxID=3076558 RepID=UPI0028ED7BD1|nr:hypothetical protein [Paraflavitalea speifideiaquila]
MHPILTNLFGLLLFLVFAVLPAWYTNKYLLQLIRPKESVARLLAHIIICLAAAVLYTSIVIIVLVKFVFPS